MMEQIIRKELATKTVAIAGCGGLGSNCAVSLARVGTGRLIIADFDVVSEGNLNRQYFFKDQIGEKKAYALKENILRIDPKLKIEAHDLKLDAKAIQNLFSDADVIVEAFDRADMKQMIIETVLEFFPNKPIVAASGLAGWGKTDILKTQVFGNLYLCGDGEHEVSEENPPLGPRVGIVSNMQANIVMELLLKNIKQ